MYFVTRTGWVLEMVKGRWFWNFVRILIHARGIRRGSPQPGPPLDDVTTGPS